MSEILYLLCALYFSIFYVTNLYLFFRFQFRQLFLQEDLPDSSRLVELPLYCLPLISCHFYLALFILYWNRLFSRAPHGLYIFLRVKDSVLTLFSSPEVKDTSVQHLIGSPWVVIICEAETTHVAAMWPKLDPHNRVCYGGLCRGAWNAPPLLYSLLHYVPVHLGGEFGHHPGCGFGPPAT